MAFGEFQGVAVDPSTNTLVPTTTTKNDWSTRLPSPEEAAALGNVEATQQEQQQIAQDDIAAARERDLNARLAADQKAQDAINEQEALKKANDDMLAQRRQIMGEIEEASRAKQKASNITTLWEDKPTWQKVLSAIGVGLGQGASIQGGGPNGAMQMYQHAQELDQKRKHDRLEAATEELKMKGASLEHLNKFHEMALKDIEASRLAQDRATAAYIEGLGAAYPKFQQEAKAAAAKLAADSAEKLFQNTSAIHEVRKSGGTSKTTPGTPAGGTGQVPFNVKEASIEARAKAEALRELQTLAKNAPAVELYRKAIKEELESAELEKSGSGPLLRSARGMGAADVTTDQRIRRLGGKDQKAIDDAIRISRKMPIVVAATARQLDDKGAMTDATLDYGRRALALPNLNTQRLQETVAPLLAKQEDIIRSADESIARAQAPVAARAASVMPKGVTAKHRAALKWAAEHPKDPRSKQVVAKVRAELGQ